MPELESVVFTEQFYYPEGWGGAQLPRDLTMHLVRNGVSVEVICGSDQYAPVEEGDDDQDPRTAGVVIRRVPRLFGGGIHSFKLLRQLFFYLASAPVLLFRRAPQLFATQTNPPLLVPMVAAAALIRRRPFVIVAQDVYPEVMFAHGMARAGSLPGRILRQIFRWAYRRANRVIALGPVMARRLVEKGVEPDRITVISNWATGREAIDRSAENPLRQEWGLTGKFVILYSGNVGIAHDVETPIIALKTLLARSPHVRLVFIGKGSRLEDARRAAEAAGVSHAVQFRPLVPAAQLPRSLGLAQIALVTLRDGFEGLVVPSKLLGYMARGVPTMYVGPYSDVEQILIDSGGGACVRNGDATGFTRVIQELIEEPRRLEALGRAAADYYERHLSRAIGLQEYSRVLGSVVASPRN